jgi:hypothetical protein
MNTAVGVAQTGLTVQEVMQVPTIHSGVAVLGGAAMMATIYLALMVRLCSIPAGLFGMAINREHLPQEGTEWALN